MKYEINKFKDGQVSSFLRGEGNLKVEIRGNSYEDLFKIASIKEVWDHHNALNKGLYSEITINCLIGQRSDRRFEERGSFDLKVIAGFINSMQFDKVKILDPHSSISIALIDNAEEISPFPFIALAVKRISSDNLCLVSPDAGAYKKVDAIATKLKVDMVASNKVRINGEPVITFVGDVKDRHCLIVDDMADGGRTFVELAKKLREQGASKVYLYVTHGMFHYGFDELKESIDHVYCTNSYRDIDDPFVTQWLV